jgi:malonate-semialdehyde dehydrogenase (acetylating)/methylmalonate-semialdehyde dehydrogenase
MNVVNGDENAVNYLLDDTRVQAISFVGSTPVAEHVYSRGTKSGKRVQALGGAKNHAVVMPDADMDNVAASLMGAAFGSCGERCMAVSIVVAVGNETADSLVERLAPQMNSLVVGPGTKSASEMGPLIPSEHAMRVRSFIDSGINEGAALEVDGRAHQLPSEGFFLGPSLFDHVHPSMSIYSNEIFGPVLGIMRVDSLNEAMALIDAHEYGNGTCIFTRDGEAARYFSDRINVGMVGVNVPLPVPVAYHSFGGWKRSLFGDLHAYGPDAMRFYTRRKTITQRWPSSGSRETARYSFPQSDA